MTDDIYKQIEEYAWRERETDMRVVEKKSGDLAQYQNKKSILGFEMWYPPRQQNHTKNHFEQLSD